MSSQPGEGAQRPLVVLPTGWININAQNNTIHTLAGSDAISCASPGASLTTFAIVNLLTLFGAFILGRATFRSRFLPRWLSEPWKNDRNDSIPQPESFLRPRVFIPALIMIILELISTVVGAYLAYNTGLLGLHAVILMSLARPRGTWITIVVSWCFARVMKKLGVIKDRKMWMGNYQSSHFTMIASEIVLEVIGVIPTIYLLGTVAGVGRGETTRASDPYTRLMYTGAFVYINGIAISTSIFGIAVYLWVRKRFNKQHTGNGNNMEARLKTVKRRRRLIMICLFTFGWIPALGSWMIWTGFVHAAKD